MKKMFLVAMAAIWNCFAFSQDSTISKLGELMNAYHSAGRFNGSVLVAQKGNILLHKGYGKNNGGETIYQIASITKPFTAAVILKLVELKKLSLTDKLSKFYPGFDNNITIEHLLHHTSGIVNITETDAGIAGANEKPLIDYLQKAKLDFEPGKGWHYSNSGYIILGHIIPKVTRLSYYEAVRKYIFQPLDMENSGFDFVHLNKKEKAIGYENDSTESGTLDSTMAFAAGAIYASVGDLYKWHQGLQKYSVISKPLMEKSYEPSTMKTYGYGWQIDSIYGRKMVSHSGSILGFGSNLARIAADDICIVLLSNRAQSTFELINITQKLLAVLYGQPYTVPVKRVPLVVTEDQLKIYTGTYELQERKLTIDMNLENGKLVARPHNGPPSVMVSFGKNKFYSDSDEELEIEFVLNEKGEVFQFLLNHRDRKATGIKTK